MGKVGQCHGIGTQRKGTGWDIQGKTIGQVFHNVSIIQNRPALDKRRPILIRFELAFLDSAAGALISTSTAGNAGVSVDLVLAVALENSGNGALVSASAAGNASISNNVSHGVTSK
jgi:hypothetical protein